MCVVFVAFHFMMTPDEKTCEKSQLILTIVATSKTTTAAHRLVHGRYSSRDFVISFGQIIIVLHKRLSDYRFGLFKEIRISVYDNNNKIAYTSE